MLQHLGELRKKHDDELSKAKQELEDKKENSLFELKTELDNKEKEERKKLIERHEVVLEGELAVCTHI